MDIKAMARRPRVGWQHGPGRVSGGWSARLTGRSGAGEWCSPPGFQSFRGTLDIGAQLCRRGGPEAESVIEWANRCFETGFLPGRHFESGGRLEHQFTGWLRRTNQRLHATTKGAPGRGDLRRPRKGLPWTNAVHIGQAARVVTRYGDRKTGLRPVGVARSR